MSAFDWIKMRNNLGDDPRVLRVAEITRVSDVDLIVGKLHRLWCNADEHTTGGRLPHATHETIDKLLDLPGIAAALELVGWLEFDEKGAKIPRFTDHNGASAKRRAMDSKRKARGRKPSTDGPQDVRKVSASRADKKRTVVELERERESERERELKNDPERTSKPPLSVAPDRSQNKEQPLEPLVVECLASTATRGSKNIAAFRALLNQCGEASVIQALDELEHRRRDSNSPAIRNPAGWLTDEARRRAGIVLEAAIA